MGTSPENSLEGIAAALADGVDAIEVDVRASRDGVAMLLHDATLARTHGDARALGALTASEARAAGVPALEDALAAVGGRATLCIEVKERDLERAVAAEVRAAAGAGWCWTWAFDPSVARACRDALPEVPVALNVNAASMSAFGFGSPIDVAADARLAAISLDQRLVTRELVDAAHARGLRVFTWTVDEESAIRAVLEAGVDGVCGNYPRRIRAVIEVIEAGR